MSVPASRRVRVLPLIVLAVACEAPREAQREANGPGTPSEGEGDVRPAISADARTPRVAPAPRATAPRPERDLPDGWETAPPAAFEKLIADLRAGDSAFAWSPAARSALVEALGEEDRAAVHAVVLFAHAHDATSTEALLSRLEARHVAAARSLDAGDVVAAAALDTLPLNAEQLARLAVLAEGPDPHPDLEVRVEIARCALARGADAVIPFLLRVLRALTPAEALDPPDWKRITTLAWAKSRAAEALSARAGEAASRFRPDASWEDQMREAERLETLLARPPR